MSESPSPMVEALRGAGMTGRTARSAGGLHGSEGAQRTPAHDNVTVRRRGARLEVRSESRALSERQARAISRRYLHDGERLLDCIERDGSAALGSRFTFVIWPKTASHTGQILRDLKAA